jgi:hypothetical protein
VDEPNKRKTDSHTKKIFYALLLQIPIIGKPAYDLLKSKGGFMKKLGGFGLIVIVTIVLVWLHYEHTGQQATSHNKTASTDGNNSPATNQVATQSGTNNTLNQVAARGTLTYGISDETYKQMQEDMLALQKQKDAELRAIFKYGYILFTATERNEIVPLNSPIDNILTIDWNAGYNISFSDETIKLRMPTITYEPTKIRLEDCTIRMPKDGTLVSGLFLGKHIIAYKVISIKKDSVIIAMGILDKSEYKPQNP